MTEREHISNEHLKRALYAIHEFEMRRAPDNHPKETANCLPFSYSYASAKGSWTTHQQLHLLACAHCAKVAQHLIPVTKRLVIVLFIRQALRACFRVLWSAGYIFTKVVYVFFALVALGVVDGPKCLAILRSNLVTGVRKLFVALGDCIRECGDRSDDSCRRDHGRIHALARAAANAVGQRTASTLAVLSVFASLGGIIVKHFVNVLFECSHRRKSFPMTPPRRGGIAQRQGTYVVCLDCGKQFDYDWENLGAIGTASDQQKSLKPGDVYARPKTEF
jgi:hypothetical protein